MIYYLINPGCTDPSGKPLFLTAIKETMTVEAVTQISPNDPLQLWTPVMDGQTDNAFVLLNKATNMVIAAPSGNAPVVLAPSNTMNRATWLFVGPGALQLQADTDQNLNVSGNGPYPSGTSVLVWEWSGGDPNEVWKMTRVII